MRRQIFRIGMFFTIVVAVSMMTLLVMLASLSDPLAKAAPVVLFLFLFSLTGASFVESLAGASVSLFEKLSVRRRVELAKWALFYPSQFEDYLKIRDPLPSVEKKDAKTAFAVVSTQNLKLEDL